MASLIKSVYYKFKRYPSVAALARGYGEVKHQGRLLALLSTLRHSKQGWTIRMGDSRIALENRDDFFMALDLRSGGHYDKMYASAPPGSVVWDIGANIGVASLFFAQNPNIDHVYAYEPMPYTFEWAKRSLGLNPALAAKIDLRNEGIGNSDKEIHISYTKRAKSAAGVSDIPQRMKDQYGLKEDEMEQVTVHIVDADGALKTIRENHPKATILLKLDAEGIEYEVIDRLVETGRISEIAAAVIEWHGSPGELHLVPALQRSNFRTEARVLTADPIGMIDAWR
jgi:FkbM family methyltransferase